MRTIRIMAALLVAAMVVSASGCGLKKVEQPPVATVSEVEGNENSDAETTPVKKGDIHIAIETVTVTAEEVKAADYIVPVCVRLENNSGITYSEWGLKYDTRCTLTAETGIDDLDEEFLAQKEENFYLIFNGGLYYSINEEKHFLWTAWASGMKEFTKTGDMMVLFVKLPMDVTSGETYSIEYADWSLADKSHIWQGSTDWVSTDSVTWENGGITIS